MGFICVVRNEETDVAKLKKGVWPDAYIYGEDAKEPEKLTNGANVIVTPNSIAVQTKDGKLVDIITTPGGYLYHENAPVNERLEDYATFMQGMVELFMQVQEWKRPDLLLLKRTGRFLPRRNFMRGLCSLRSRRNRNKHRRRLQNLYRNRWCSLHLHSQNRL